MDILCLILLYLFLAILAQSRRAGGRKLGAGTQNAVECVCAEGSGAACGAQRKKWRRASGRCHAFLTTLLTAGLTTPSGPHWLPLDKPETRASGDRELPVVPGTY